VGIELVGLLAITAALLLVLLLRPATTRERGGRVLAFLGILALPTLAFAVGFNAHVERSKKREFCLSCHIMEPYGKSLAIDDDEYVPASHVQNNRVHRDEACFTCHTTYALYGDIKAKIGGLRHIAVNYLGAPPDTIRLYRPYNNRECLHCHGSSRSFVEAGRPRPSSGSASAMSPRAAARFTASPSTRTSGSVRCVAPIAGSPVIAIGCAAIFRCWRAGCASRPAR